MIPVKLYCLMIRIKKNDTVGGKRTHLVILEILKKSKINGATVWTGVEGYGKHGTSNFQIEGISVNMPMVIEAIDDISKIESALPDVKKAIGDHGLITIHEVGVV